MDTVLEMDRPEPEHHHHHYYIDYDSTDIINHRTRDACLIDDNVHSFGYLPTCTDTDCPVIREQKDDRPIILYEESVERCLHRTLTNGQCDNCHAQQRWVRQVE